MPLTSDSRRAARRLAPDIVKYIEYTTGKHLKNFEASIADAVEKTIERGHFGNFEFVEMDNIEGIRLHHLGVSKYFRLLADK